MTVLQDNANREDVRLVKNDDTPRANSTNKMGVLGALVAGAIEARVMVILILIFVSILGLFFAVQLHVDAVPDVSNVQVTVTANARGLAPKEVEQYITYPIEMALQSLPRLTQLRSLSKFSLSQVTAVFEDGCDIYWARQQVSERLKTASEQLPANEIKIALGPIASGLGEIYQFRVIGSGHSLMQLRDILDWQVIPSLKTVPGVDEIQAMGGEAREYQVQLDPERMHGYRINASEVMAALSKNNMCSGGGYMIENDDQTLIRGESMLHTPEDIANVVIKRTAFGAIKVRNLATVVIGHKQAQSIVTADGNGESVIGVAVMRKGENSKNVLKELNVAVKTLNASLPSGVAVVPFYDRSVLIERTIDTVWHNLLHGAFFVVVVLVVLLGDLRGAFIAALAIPFSLLGALSFLSLTNTSGNLLSLGAIDFGILIDGSVVMVENIIRRLAENPQGDRLKNVQSSAGEVAKPIFFAVLIITAVYLPILALPGVSGKTFQPMALTVIFGLLTALMIGLFITPSLAYFILPKHPSEKDTYFLRLLQPGYRRLLLSAVKHPKKSITFASLFFIASLFTLPLLGSEFVPKLKEGALVLTVNRPVSGSLAAAANETTLMEKIIKAIPDVETVVSRTGHSEIAFDPMGADETDMFVILKPAESWKTAKTQVEIEDVIVNKLRKSVPGAVFSVSQPIEQRMNELIAGAKSDVAVRIFGPDLEKLRELGGAAGKLLAEVPGAADVKLEQTTGLPVVSARIDSAKLAAYGVTSQEALDTVAASQSGKVVGTIYQGKPRYDLCVKFAEHSMQKTEDIGSLPVGTTSGELVPLNQICSIDRREDAAQITHLQTDRNYMVQVNVRNRDLGSFVKDARTILAKHLKLPPGYRMTLGGQFESLLEAQNRLFLLVPIVLLLIFVLLYASFGSFGPGLLIFSNVPLALSGGLLALWFRGMPLSITSGVGFIALFGVAVLNGVVLVSTIQQIERNENIGPRRSALKAAKQRTRPVLMTALVASLGFMPMALATSIGAEVQRPLATVVIGGLITSTLLTLIVIPAAYSWLRQFRMKRMHNGL
ncbi:MAG: CusA/CzcA family heavy metal efflux RND transporter [Candidatus Obscuribacterales bacterium]|nr:CusA/CzcA family heavy metal efflux RND transporter [Candidatus Obscuribacterales bacterium]